MTVHEQLVAALNVLLADSPPEGVATKPAADGEVSKAAQPLQTTEPESDHCQTSGGEA